MSVLEAVNLTNDSYKPVTKHWLVSCKHKICWKPSTWNIRCRIHLHSIICVDNLPAYFASQCSLKLVDPPCVNQPLNMSMPRAQIQAVMRQCEVSFRQTKAMRIRYHKIWVGPPSMHSSTYCHCGSPAPIGCTCWVRESRRNRCIDKS